MTWASLVLPHVYFMAGDAHLVAKLLCQDSKLIAFGNICLGLVDDAIPVAAHCLLELLGTVLILIVALGNQVRPRVWPGMYPSNMSMSASAQCWWCSC